MPNGQDFHRRLDIQRAPAGHRNDTEYSPMAHVRAKRSDSFREPFGITTRLRLKGQPVLTKAVITTL
jgi:hypothetical protein